MGYEHKYDTLAASMATLARTSNEGRELADGIEDAAEKAAAAAWAWKRHRAKVTYSSTEKSADRRDAQALDSPEGAELYRLHLKAEAHLTAVTERLRWARSAVSGAMTATSVHKAELEAMNVEHGLAEDREPNF